MGAPKQKWTSEEEDALRAGVRKHGAGKWRTIQKDPEFSPVLSSRSNIDLKDKWRNLSFSASGLGSSKLRVPKITGPSSSPSSSSQPLLLPAANKFTEATLPADAEKKPQDGKTLPKYGAMIMEALLELNEPNGSDIAAIFGFIEIDKSYRLPDSLATRTPAPMNASAPKQKDPSKPSKVSKAIGLFSASSPALEAAMAAAVKVADAEAKAHDAHDQTMEAERIFKMAEDTESLLIIAAEIYDRCSRGEITTLVPVAQREI
ncbi:Homeodomain-like/winged-helix DNA-binding family protein [Zea mays]|uniref:Homeodomain-like/winged-helix DNA-binding family protein n=1 Tax=Zea mays TaxID=4577 RepID=A0A1D6NEC9_MAIZE|nr:Homeodomain-like/winged-helix DNA-binding family protein [Zea mays]